MARRPRTLSPVSAVYECSALARAKVRAGGVTRPSAEPSKAGHNIVMVPDVVKEASTLLRNDEVLKRRQPELIVLLTGALEVLARADVDEENVLRAEAFAQSLRRTYLSDAFSTLEDLAEQSPRELYALEQVCGSLISELRARGWSDATLNEILSGPIASVTELLITLRTLDRSDQTFHCYVAVTVTTHRVELEASERLSFVDTLPAKKVIGPFPSAKGPYANVEVSAVDFRFAAELAYSQVSSVLGAAAVFVKTDMLVRSTTVVVETADELRTVDAHLRLPRESRRAKTGQLTRVVRSAADAASRRSIDSIFDAIRHRQRAIEASDLESRFMLLWLGIERLCLGSPDHHAIMQSVRSLVPPAIALGKLRREISALRTHLARRTGANSAAKSRSAVELLRLIRDPDPRALTSEFYDDDPLAAQWVSRLQSDLRATDGIKVAEYFERSRERLEWQVLRLYRARNSVAHAARGPAWLTDLVVHAHFYLTQLIAICVEHRDEAGADASAEILLQRCAQYGSFIDLLRANNKPALDEEILLRPTALVGSILSAHA